MEPTYCKSCDLNMSEYEVYAVTSGMTYLETPGGNVCSDHHSGHCPSCGEKLIVNPEDIENE